MLPHLVHAGEGTTESICALLDAVFGLQVSDSDVKLTPAKSHFVDLGSGFGKVVFHAALHSRVGRVSGIELISQRYAMSQNILQQLQQKGLNTHITFTLGSVTDISLYTGAGYTHIFAFDAAFDAVTCQAIAQILCALPQWRVFVSYRTQKDWQKWGLTMTAVAKMALKMSVSGELKRMHIFVRSDGAGSTV